MCLIAFAHQTHPQYRLVLVANRDEFYDRESSAMHWWPDDDSILAGRDEVAKGTWLGMNRSGKWSAVTNFRGPSPAGSFENPANPISRGDLVKNYLAGDDSAQQYREKIKTKLEKFSGFNLLIGDRENVFWISNRNQLTGKLDDGPLAPGLYGLSNHLLDTDWPKLTLAKQRLEDRMLKFDSSVELIDTLQDQTRPSDDRLPDTGVGLEKERLLSSMFIESKPFNYGTRCSTVLTISNDNEISVFEKTYPSNTIVEHRFTCSVD
ncbi:MAG: NRDE family protein [Mariniblastus sp.]